MNIADTIKILKRLRTVQAEYPTHLLAPRRDEFFNQMAAIRADMKANQSGQGSGQSSSGSASSFGAPAGVVEQLLQYALIGTFIAVSALGVHTYWDEIRHFFSPNTVDVQGIIDSQEGGDALDGLSLSPVPSDDAIFTSTPTLTPTPTEALISFTPTPRRDADPDPEDTPIPAPASTSTHPGLHIGQTKTPKPK